MNNKKDYGYRNTPKKSGIYWAKKDSSYEWWNLIVEIYGELPYLGWKAWDRGKDKIISGNSKPDFIFGEEIIEPNEDIQKLDNVTIGNPEEIKLHYTIIDNFKIMTSNLMKEIRNEIRIAEKKLEIEKLKNQSEKNFEIKHKLISIRKGLVEDYQKILNSNDELNYGKREIYLRIVRKLNTIISDL